MYKITRPTLAILPTGVANLASITAGLKRTLTSTEVNARPAIQPVTDAASIRNAEYLVVPGVGAFGPAMKSLRQRGLVAPLVRRLEERRPTLLICLGLQLLMRGSEEAPGVAGLGLIDAEVEAFPAGLVSPHMGWNQVSVDDAESSALEDGVFYFANSYRLRAAPAGWTIARCTYDSPFVAALASGDVLACQFHPEISGTAGASLLARWFTRAERALSC